MLYGGKIKNARKRNGFTQEDMASKLNISQNTYSDIENNKSKLTVDMLLSIATELDVSPMELISSEPSIVNMGTMHNSMQYVGNIEHFYSYQKELVESMKQIADAVTQSNERVMKLLEKER